MADAPGELGGAQAVGELAGMDGPEELGAVGGEVGDAAAEGGKGDYVRVVRMRGVLGGYHLLSVVPTGNDLLGPMFAVGTQHPFGKEGEAETASVAGGVTNAQTLDLDRGRAAPADRHEHILPVMQTVVLAFEGCETGAVGDD